MGLEEMFDQLFGGSLIFRGAVRQVEFQTRAIFGPMFNDLAFEEDDRIFQFSDAKDALSQGIQCGGIGSGKQLRYRMLF